MKSTVNTTVQYTDTSGRLRTKITNRFGYQTNLSDIRNWISEWWTGIGTFYLEIKDPHGGFVDFDDDYINDYRPFGVSEPTQPSTSTSLEIELQIVNMRDDHQSLSVEIPGEKLIGKSSVLMHQEQQESTSIAVQSNSDVQGATPQNRFSSWHTPDLITIDQKKAGMEFTKNVKDTQRDQHITDNTNGKFVSIQAEKGTANRTSVNPKLKISHPIPQNERPRWTLVIFLVYELCQNGKRKLYHNDERQFITNDDTKMEQSTSSLCVSTPSEIEDKNKSRREPIILNLTDEMFSECGEDLVLKTIVIPGSRTQSIKKRHLFCELTNEYPSNTNYETTRLACVLAKNDNILCDHLILSNAMIFPESKREIGDIEIKDNNGSLLEKIPVRIMKRKTDLNQSDTVTIRPPRIKNAKKNVVKIDASSREVNEGHQGQSMSVPLQNQVEYSMPPTRAQFRDPNLQNDYVQYQNQVESPFIREQYPSLNLPNEYLQYQKHPQYLMRGTEVQYQDPILQNEHVQHHYMMYSHSRMEDPSNHQYLSPPMPTNNLTDNYFQNQSTTTATNLYGNPAEETNQEITFTPTTLSQSKATKDSIFCDFSSCEQQESSFQGSLTLPSIKSFLTQNFMGGSSEDLFLSDENEDFTDIDQS